MALSKDMEKNGFSSPISSDDTQEGYIAGVQKRSRFNLAVAQEPSSFAKSEGASNADFDPIPPRNRTWGMGAFAAYWMADAWAVSNWEVGR